MSRFTPEEIERAFGQVSHEYPQDVDSVTCKNLLKFLLTNTPEDVVTGIHSTPDYNMGEMNKYLKTIIGNTDIVQLEKFIRYINGSSVNSSTISEIIGQQPHHKYIPIYKVCLQMLQNREEGLAASAHPLPSAFLSARPSAFPSSHPLPSARPSAFPSARPSAFPSARPSAFPSARPPASATTKLPSASSYSFHQANLTGRHLKAASVEPSARPLQSAIFKKPATKRHTPLTPSEIENYKKSKDYRTPNKWYTQSSKNNLRFYIHKKTKLLVTPSEYMQIVKIQRGGGGSRRRRTSHRKRKSYRKSKCVRHTRRKQTRRHRHRRSRHRR